MKPELYLSDARCDGKPMFRVHTAGSVGSTTGIVAAARAGGQAQDRPGRRLREAVRGQRQFAGQRRGASSAPAVRSRRLCPFHIHRSGAPSTSGGRYGRRPQNAREEPFRHLKIEDISIEKVKESPDALGADPLPRVLPVVRRRLRRGPHRRGGGRRRRPTDGRLRGSSVRRRARSRRASRAATRWHRWRPRCAQDVYDQAGITNPREQIDMAELYVPSRGTRRSGSRPTASPIR